MQKAAYIFFLIVVFSRCVIAQNAFEQMAAGQYTTATAVTGWTVETAATTPNGSCPSYTFNQPNSEFFIRQTPIASVAAIGTIPNSPLGGTKVAQLNSATGGSVVTRLRTTFTVNYANAFMQYAFCGTFEDGSHLCCQQSFFRINIYDCNGTLLNCSATSAVAAGSGCPGGSPGYSVSSVNSIAVSWTNWQVRWVDLSQYLGSCITMEVLCGDCAQGDHHGILFVDAQVAAGQLIGQGLSAYVYDPVNAVNFCPGSSVASIIGPPGYLSYQWVSPTTGTIPAYLGGTASSLTINNPVPGSIYTLNLSNANCYYTQTFTIVSSFVSITGIGSSPSCPLGSGGSATVVPGGANSYTYTWKNAANAVVGTNAVASNLPAGNYTVTVGGGTCGNATATVSVGTATPGVTSFLNYYCNGEAYLHANNGTGYQWYHNTTSIAAPLGTAQNYTASATGASDVYRVAYMNTGGCKDSLEFYLDPATPGSLAVSNNSNCAGSATGYAVFSLNAAYLAPPGVHSFSVTSTGTTAGYSYSFSSASANSFSLTNLSAGGTYSINAFDGFCKYSSTFNVTTNTTTPTSFTVIPFSQATQTACGGMSLIANVWPQLFFSYTYDWLPASLVLTSNQNAAVLTTPTVGLGSTATFVYSVVITPTFAPCPQTKTFAIAVANPVTPTITAVPALCSNAPPYNIIVNPAGGTFAIASGAIGVNSGVLNASSAGIGVNTFTYNHFIGGCSAQTSASFTVLAAPAITVSGNTLPCGGGSTTLNASGTAGTYTWNTGVQSPSLSVTLSATQAYTVAGTGSNSCVSAVVTTVNVPPDPILSISGNTFVCVGGSTTLQAFGANSYNWDNTISGPVFTISPLATGTYTLEGTNTFSCLATKVITVAVIPDPVLSIAGPTAICTGESTTLTVSGADTYSWSTGWAGPSLSVAPVVTSFYQVSGTTNPSGCSSSILVTLVVSPCTGIAALQGNMDIELYPNPTSGNIQINLSRQTRLALSDAKGALLLEHTVEKGTYLLDLLNYSAGIYFLSTVDEAKKTAHVKIVKTQ